MNRFLAFLLALLFASVTVSSACVAAPSDLIHFSLRPNGNGRPEIYASFGHDGRDRDRTDWSSSFRPSELIGLDIAGFRGAGARPLRFAVVREAGRLDCAGNGGGSYAAGNCRFTPDERFAQMLVSRGIARPTRDQAFGMMAINVRRDIVDAVFAARYPRPTVDDLMALTAVGVTGRYIGEMARAGYRPRTIQSLIEFKALEITPQWIGGFARIGYANIPQHDLIQLKAMEITPEFVAGFDRIGYRHLPASTLVQLKALDITPEFVRSAVGTRAAMPPVNELVEMKIFGRRR